MTSNNEGNTRNRVWVGAIAAILSAALIVGARWYWSEQEHRKTKTEETVEERTTSTGGQQSSRAESSLPGSTTTRVMETRKRNKSNVIAIFYGSQTGTAESFATNLAVRIEEYFPSLEARVIDLEDFEASMILEEFCLGVFVLATFGTGEPTDNARKFSKWLTLTRREAQVSLDGFRFALCGLGDTNYPNFNAFGRKVDGALARLGAERICPKGECDDSSDSSAQYIEWRETVLIPALGSHMRSLSTTDTDKVMEGRLRHDEIIGAAADIENPGGPVRRDKTPSICETSTMEGLPRRRSSGVASEIAKVVDDIGDKKLRNEYAMLGERISKPTANSGEINTIMASEYSTGYETVCDTQRQIDDRFRLYENIEKHPLAIEWLQTLHFEPKGILAKKYFNMRPCKVIKITPCDGDGDVTKDRDVNSVNEDRDANSVNKHRDANSVNEAGDGSSVDKANNISATASSAAVVDWRDPKDPLFESVRNVVCKLRISQEFQPGWTLDLLPIDESYLNLIASCLTISPNDVVDPTKSEVLCLDSYLDYYLVWGPKAIKKVPFPSGLTIRMILSSFFDFSILPSRQWLANEVMPYIHEVDEVPSPSSRSALEWFTQLFSARKDSLMVDFFTIFIVNPKLTLAEIMSLILSVKGLQIRIPFSHFLDRWPKQKWRSYTIASIPKKDNTCDILFSKYYENRPPFPIGQFVPLMQECGHCVDLNADPFLFGNSELLSMYRGAMTIRSFCVKDKIEGQKSFLCDVSPSRLSEVTSSTRLRNKAGLWLCVGTGIAPIRAFLADRKKKDERKESTDDDNDDRNNDKDKQGDFSGVDHVLIYGCRSASPRDFLCQQEIQEAVSCGYLTSAVFAFSRDVDRQDIKKSSFGFDKIESRLTPVDENEGFKTARCDEKIYVQHRLKECADLAWDILDRQKGYVVICGLTSFGRSCIETLNRIAAAMTHDDEFVTTLQNEGRCIIEVWDY